MWWGEEIKVFCILLDVFVLCIKMPKKIKQTTIFGLFSKNQVISKVFDLFSDLLTIHKLTEQRRFVSWVDSRRAWTPPLCVGKGVMSLCTRLCCFRTICRRDEWDALGRGRNVVFWCFPYFLNSCCSPKLSVAACISLGREFRPCSERYPYFPQILSSIFCYV